MENYVTIEPFKIIGLAIKTTNQDGQSKKDLKTLWDRFYAEGIFSKIPDKQGMEIYAVYTDYESDQNGPYYAIIGCNVSTLEHVPPGLTGKAFPGGKHLKFTARGKLPEAVVETWQKIWDSGIKRTFTVDFEVYGEGALDPNDAEVGILVAVE